MRALFATETSSKIPRPRLDTSKFVHLPKLFFNVVITSKLHFFKFLCIFPTSFGCFLPANTTNNKSFYRNFNYRNFTLPVLCSFHSLETCSLRDRDETRNLLDRDWDSQIWVSRRVSRPSLETSSLGVETVKCFVNVHLHCTVSNLKKISKMSNPLENVLRTHMVTFTRSTSFGVKQVRRS